MPAYRTARVVGSLSERAGLHRVQIEFDPPLPADHPALRADRAFALTGVSGPVTVGHRVLLNTTAVELDLGTGGWHVVVADLDAAAWAEPGPGHVMKLRYTGQQIDTGVAEERGSDGLAIRGLGGMPVVVGTVHSQLAGIAVGLAAARAGLRVAYVMTDGGALPLALSDVVADLLGAGLLHVTITAGHAFGGDIEAVNVPSALDLARHRAGADIAVVVMGPGVIGTGTRLGTTALEAAPALDAAAALGGQPILCPRFSRADARERHNGVSHHTTTVLELVRSRVTVPVPSQLRELVPPALAVRHDVITLDAPEAGGLLDAAGITVTTMGRTPAQDPDFFAACSATGVHAAASVEP